MAVTVNTTERRVSISISRGPKGAPFTYEDFTPEQLDNLKLRFADLTPEDKEELKLKFSDLTPEEKEELSLKWEDLTPEQKLELKGDKGDAFTFEDFTVAQLASLKGEKGDPFTYEDFTQEQKDEVFNTFLSNFYDPSIVALSSRGSNEGATFEVKLNKIQDEMNVLDPLPSLLMLPSGVKAGKLYSILPEDGSGDFTVDRNSTATRVNAEGLIEEVQPNVPRIDYSTGDPMLLVEGQRTNSIPWSEDFNHREWSKSNFTPNSLSTQAPDGSFITGFDFGDGYVLDDYSKSDSSYYSTSIWIKANKNTTIGYRNAADGAGGVSDNIVITTEWQRITSSGFNSSDRVRVLLDNRLIFGWGTPDLKVWIWGAQVEQGSEPTSYIPTNGGISTRLADNMFQEFPKTGDVVITFDDDTTQTISGIEGETFTLPEGVIKKVEML